MASILDLPSEVLHNIVNLVQDQRTYNSICLTRRTYYTLCLTSRRFHALATPRLYSYLNLPGRFGMLSSQYQPGRLLSLLHALSIHPERAAYFTQVQLEAWDVPPEDGDEIEDDRLLQFLFAAVDNITEGVDGRRGAEINKQLKAELKDGSEDALLTVFLSLCPNLESLGAMLPDDQHCFNRLFASQTPAKFFPRLESVSLSHWDTENGISFDSICPFLRLPTLTSLRGHMVSEEGDEATQFANLPSKGCNVRSLCFGYSALSSFAFSEALRVPRALVDFEYVHGGASVGYAEFVARDLGSALRANCSSSLETLVIDVDDIAGEYDTPLGFFSSFQKLRILDVSLPLLLHQTLLNDLGEVSLQDAISAPGGALADLLPVSIEELTLQKCNGHSEVGAALGWTISKRDSDKFPALKKISLTYVKICVHKDTGAQMFSSLETERTVKRPDVLELKSICDEVGVELVVDY